MSSQDVLFLEKSAAGYMISGRVRHIVDEPDKRKRARMIKQTGNLLKAIELVPKGLEIVGLAIGHDSLGVEGIFVILDKTTVQGELTVHSVKPHTFHPHLANAALCSQCGLVELDIIHDEPRRQTVQKGD